MVSAAGTTYRLPARRDGAPDPRRRLRAAPPHDAYEILPSPTEPVDVTPAPPTPVDAARARGACARPRDLADIAAKVVARRAPLLRRRRAALPRTPTCSPSAAWPTSCASGCTATASTTTSTGTSSRRTCARRSARSARSGARRHDPEAYEMSHEDVYERAAACVAEGATEVHIVAGPPPAQFDLAWYEEMLRGLKARFPHAPPEVLHGGRDRLLREAPPPLPRDGARAASIDAGLDSMPGGGAEIFAPRGAHGRSATTSATPTSGSRSTARPTAWACAATARCSTATSRRDEHRVDHVLRLRALQDETDGFQAFIPLAFHPDEHARSPTSRARPAASTCASSPSRACCSTTCRT